MARQRPLSTRRAQIEEQRARRNLVLALVVTITLGILFLIFAMPLIFRVVVQFARQGGEGTSIGDTIPPQRPVFQPPAEFMNSKEFSINGFTEAKAKVDLVIDGQVVATTEAGDDGGFSLKTNLDEKQYDILVAATDEAGNMSQSSNYSVTVDTTKPTLLIDSPKNNTTFTLRSEQVVSIIGMLSEKGEVRVNGSRHTTNEDGEFTARFTLKEGDNDIEIIGIDQAGNQSDATVLDINYDP
jgi:hypothetical protein